MSVNAYPANDSMLHDQVLFSLVSGDDDQSLPISFSLVSDVSHGTLSLDSEGNYEYTPDTGYVGDDSFEFEVTNGTDTDTATADIDVFNTAPVADDAGETLLHDQVLESWVTGEDADDLEELSFSLADDGAHGAAVVNADGSYTYTPDAGYVGSDILYFTVTDGAASDIGSVTVDIYNTAAEGDDASETVLHDRPLSSSVTAYDPDGDSLAYAVATAPTNGAVSVNGDGSCTYTPGAGFVGNDSFTFVANDGAADSDPATVSIDVTNTVPVAVDAVQAVLHDAVLQFWAPAYDDLDPFIFSLAGDGDHGTAVVYANGSYSYTPDAGYVGSDVFYFAVSDGAESDTASVTVDVYNTAPSADDDSKSILHDTVLSASLSGDDPDGDALAYSLATDAEHGAAVVNPDGTYTYTPDDTYVGGDSFDFSLTDGAASMTATVQIDVTPTASDDYYATGIGATLTVAAPGLLGNDYDDPSLTALPGDSPDYGTLDYLNADGSFEYTPEADYSGTASFLYYVFDGFGSVPAMVFIAVAAGNNAPTDITLSDDDVDENQPVNTVVGGLSASDPDSGDTHTFSLVAGPGDADNAAFAINGSDLETAAEFDFETKNTYHIRVRTTDNGGLTFDKQFTINMEDVNEKPDITNLNKTKRIGPDRRADDSSNFIYDVEATDPEDDESSITYSMAGDDVDHLFSIDANTGVVTLAKELSEATVLTYDLLITAHDPDGLTDTEHLTLTKTNTSVGVTGDTQAIERTSDDIKLKFARKSADGDYSAPLTVHFTVDWAHETLSPDDIKAGADKSKLLSLTIIIPASGTIVDGIAVDGTTAELTLDAEDDAIPAEGLESVYLKVTETSEYAVMGSAPPKDKKLKKNFATLMPYVPLQVLEKVTPFASGTPATPSGGAAHPDPAAIHENDIMQGQIGDCYFLSVLAQLADRFPGAIQNAITPVPGAGHELDFDVTLAGQTTRLTLDLSRGPGAAKLSGDYDANGVEVWPQIMEQAYAEANSGYTEIGDGGLPSDVWTAITGKPATYTDVTPGLFWSYTDQEIGNMILDAYTDNNGVMIGTIPDAPDLAGKHAYSVHDVKDDGAGNATEVILYNPWGGNFETITTDKLSENLSYVYEGGTP